MKRALTLLATAFALSGCSGEPAGTKARLSQQHDIVMLQATYAPVRNGQSGAPVTALVVSGTISNKASQPLRCYPQSFFLTDASGNAVQPSSGYCDVPAIGPNNASAFNVTFRLLPKAPVELRFEHGDGTYEARKLDLRPR